MVKRLFKKPCGETKLGVGFQGYWNNQSLGVDGPVICEICGTKYPERKDESYIISWFLGRQVVEECCGSILDRVYRESGKEFCEALLSEFAKDPADPRFHMLLIHLRDSLKEACENLEKTGSQAKEVADFMKRISGE